MDRMQRLGGKLGWLLGTIIVYSKRLYASFKGISLKAIRVLLFLIISVFLIFLIIINLVILSSVVGCDFCEIPQGLIQITKNENLAVAAICTGALIASLTYIQNSLVQLRDRQVAREDKIVETLKESLDEVAVSLSMHSVRTSWERAEKLINQSLALINEIKLDTSLRSCQLILTVSKSKIRNALTVRHDDSYQGLPLSFFIGNELNNKAIDQGVFGNNGRRISPAAALTIYGFINVPDGSETDIINKAYADIREDYLLGRVREDEINFPAYQYLTMHFSNGE